MGAQPPQGSFEHGIVTVAAAGTAQQLPNQVVPSGFAVVLKGHPANTDNVIIGNSKANAEPAAAKGYPLKPNEPVTLQVATLNKIWVDAAVSGEKLCWLIEEAD